MNYSYVCVLSTNHYLEGVLILNENLKQLKTKYPLLCLINESITEETRNILKKFEIEYKEMKAILPGNSQYSTRWKYTFDKLNVFDLTEYDKVVYLDSDFLILDNLDHLFDLEEFSMVFDFKPEDENYCCSALMVLKPNKDDFVGLIKVLETKSEDEIVAISDQDIINEYFKKKHVISVDYNFIKGIENKMVEVQDFIKKKKELKYACQNYYWSDNPVIIHYFGDLKPFMLDKEFDDTYCYLYFYYLELIRKKKETS